MKEEQTMKVSQKKKDGNEVTYEVVADAADVARALQMASVAFANSMGLQPEGGKTVAQVAEERMGIKDLDVMVAQGALDALATLALDKKNIIPAYPPKPEAKSMPRRGEPFRFLLNVSMRPEYELTSYEPITLEVQKFAIPESAVDAEIEGMTNSYTAYVPDKDADPDRAIAAGDFVKIAIKATEDGKEFKGLNTDGRTYAVGAGHMPKGFDDEVQGMKVGQTKSFTFEAPSFDKDLKETTSNIDATVTIKEMLKEQKPELTDEWVARNMPMFKTVSEMRTGIRKSIEVRERESYDAYVRQAAAAELAKRFEGKIADEVYETMMGQLRENIKLDLRQQGKTWEQFVEENGGESQLSMLLMLQAREVLVQGYALDAVFRHFGLSVSDADIEQVCRAMNPSADPKQLHEQIKQNGQGFALRESAERFKANQYVLEHAKIIHPEEAE